MSRRATNIERNVFEGATQDVLAGREDSEQVQALAEALRQKRANIGKAIQQTTGEIIQIRDDGPMTYRGFELRSTGLLAPEDASVEDFEALAAVVFGLESSLQWIIGDMLVQIENRKLSHIEAVAEIFGRSAKTLYNYSTVCRNVDFSRRRENLSFGHHEAVAALQADHQEFWLREASANGWSVSKLRQQMADRPALSSGGGTPQREIARFARKIGSIFTQSGRISQHKREEYLRYIDNMRRLLDEAEQKLR